MSTLAARPEFIWGGDLVWRPGMRQHLQPHLETSFAMAVEGIADVGLPVSGVKEITLNRVPTQLHNQWSGQCLSADSYELVFNKYEALKSGEPWYQVENAATLVHEMGHGERMRYFPKHSPHERAVSEGIAYMIEDIFLLEHDRNSTTVALTFDMDTELLDEQLDMYRMDVEQVLNGNEKRKDFYDTWFGQAGAYGNMIGVWAVTRAFEKGATLLEVVQMSPEKVLAL